MKSECIIHGSWVVLAACGLALLSGHSQAQQTGDQARLDAAFKRGQELSKAGKHEDAITQFRVVVELAPRVHGANSTSMASALNWLGGSYRDAGQYAKAEPLFQRSIKIFEAILGKDHPEVATSLSHLAMVYQSTGQHAKAEPLFQRSIEIWETKLGKDHYYVAIGLKNLAELYRLMDQCAKAEQLSLRSLKLTETNLGKDHLEVASSAIMLGQLYLTMGQYAKAEPLLQRSLYIREAKLGKDHYLVAMTLNESARLYEALGQYAKAELFYLRCLQTYEAKLGKDHVEVAAVLNNLAGLYRTLGQYAKAEPLYQRSLQIWEARLGKDHQHVASSLNNLANLYQSMGLHDKAQPLLQRSLQIFEAKLGKDHHLVATSLCSLGSLYDNVGKYAQAEPLYQQSLQIYEAKLGKDHPDVATSLHRLARLYRETGQYAKAEPLYQRSRQIYEAKLGKDHPDVAGSLHSLAILHAAQARWLEAASLLDSSRRKFVAHFQTTLPTLSAREQLNFLDIYVRHHTGALSVAYHGRHDAKTVELSASWVLNSKGLTQDALAQGLPRKSAQERALAQPACWTDLDRVRQALKADEVLIEVARFSLDDFTSASKNLPHYAVWLIPPAGKGEVEIIDLGPAEPIEQAIAAFRKTIAAAPAAILAEGEADAAKKALEALQAISKRVLAPMQEKIGPARHWLVSPDAALWLAPWGALPLADGSYAIEKHTIRYLISGRELAPAAEAVLNKGAARIIADPDFDLGPAAARAELDKLSPNPKSSTPPSTMQREAPPSLQLGKVSRLPGARAEAEAIKPKLDQYLGQAGLVYQDRQALEGVVKRFHKPGVLVLSTHGFFLADQEVAGGDFLASRGSGPALTKDGKPLENPLLRCGLLLAGCNRRAEATQADDEDGILTGQEIVGLDLEGASLVVLSACETGVGQVNVGEGVAGLRQAFQLAGARSVLATLWQISDLETARLMADFFGHLADKKDKAEALREAQLAMIKAHRDRHGAAHPFFWAAFTLTGQ